MCTDVLPTFFFMMCACGGVCVFFVDDLGVRSDWAHFLCSVNHGWGRALFARSFFCGAVRDVSVLFLVAIFCSENADV